jgi:hypothetical protein
LAIAGLTHGDDANVPPPSDEGGLSSDSAPAETTEVLPPRTRVAAGILVVAAMACSGVVLLLLVVLWGHRLRRIARTPLPRQSQLDEFWYLRHKERPARDTGQATASEDDPDTYGEKDTSS